MLVKNSDCTSHSKCGFDECMAIGLEPINNCFLILEKPTQQMVKKSLYVCPTNSSKPMLFGVINDSIQINE